jgi:hypothetical protein
MAKMEDADFDAFLASARDELSEKQDRLAADYGLGEHPQFTADLESGSLRFCDSQGHVHVEALVTPIGSFCPEDETWQWLWANKSLPTHVREKSERLKGLYDFTGLDMFRVGKFQADQQMPWEIVAMSVKYLGLLGAYRAPSPKADVYFGIEHVTTAAGTA